MYNLERTIFFHCGMMYDKSRRAIINDEARLRQLNSQYKLNFETPSNHLKKALNLFFLKKIITQRFLITTIKLDFYFKSQQVGE